jgi:SsrA-binding protein
MSTLSKNKRAYFDYNILETFEAGIVLFGYEVKSIKLGHISLQGSYVAITGNEAFLLNTHVTPYQAANMPKDYDPTRSRKLLLKRSQINSLIGKANAQGLTMVPLCVYTSKGKIKLQIGLAKSKKKYEKREALKKKATDREINNVI